MLNYILDIIFPKRCSICNDVIPIVYNDFTCKSCAQHLKRVRITHCSDCGRNIFFDNQSDCIFCGNENLYFENLFCAFPYDDLIGTAIKNGKYKNRPGIFKNFGSEMGTIFENDFQDLNIDCIIPIPIHKKRRQKRGFNQSEILSKEISKHTKIPMINNLLLREKNTKPQSAVGGFDSRKNNVKNAFAINEKSLKKYSENINTIALIDDIYTTGSTLTTCCEVLKAIGVKNIYCFCLAITKKDDDFDRQEILS